MSKVDDLNNVTKTLWTSKTPYNAETWVGSIGDIFYNPTIALLRLSDGVTPGGIPMTGGGNIIVTGSVYSNVNVAAYLPTDPTITSIQTDLGNITLAWTANALAQQAQINSISSELPTTFEVLSKNLKSYPYVINRTGSQITSIDYTTPYATTVTKTLNYSGTTIQSISITGANLSPLTYTKTLNYSGATITGASYSIA